MTVTLSLPAGASRGSFLVLQQENLVGLPGRKTHDRVGVPLRWGPRVFNSPPRSQQPLAVKTTSEVSLPVCSSASPRWSGAAIACDSGCTCLSRFHAAAYPVMQLSDASRKSPTFPVCSAFLCCEDRSENFQTFHMSDLELEILQIFHFNYFILLHSRRRSCECDITFPQ